jgi:dolichol-phosphate mannosyltransferase
MSIPSGKILLIIPAYNEVENIAKIVAQVEEQSLGLDLLFVEDNSPDGTGAEIERLRQSRSWIHVLHRPGKLGIGSAHRDGLFWAYDQDYDYAVTMDCDLTHSADKIAEFLSFADFYDVVVGTRFADPDSLPGWNPWRRFLTHAGHAATRLLLGMPYDATGGFRTYRLRAIPQPIWHLVRSQGYSFLFESLYVLFFNGARVKEVPITLPARTYGVSKMRWRDIRQSLLLLAELGKRRLLEPQEITFDAAPSTRPAVSEWDVYWSRQSNISGRVYSAIAHIYRMLFIRPNVRRSAKKAFAPIAKLLHAGCGSGETDIDLARKYDILAFDISNVALHRYRKTNGALRKVMQGSIFQMPFPQDSFDGVYNLGVMEHFSSKEAVAIFAEFHRILKPGGRVMLFWPPRYGFSVIVLGAVHRLAHRLGKTLQLHPAEPGLLESRSQGEALLKEAGFGNIDYTFGWRDLFVQVVLIAEKPR